MAFDPERVEVINADYYGRVVSVRDYESLLTLYREQARQIEQFRGLLDQAMRDIGTLNGLSGQSRGTGQAK